MVKFRALAGLGLSAMLLTGGVATVIHGVSPASASQRSDPKKAASAARKAAKALDKHQWAKAVSLAEVAVSASPTDAGYRLTLGQAYLRAGRFASAQAAFGDVLKLQPANGKAALNLALAAIAQGQWDAARHVLDDHAATIDASDRGLAVALAGDPAAGIEILTTATRSPDADAKTRQNLALAMALGGRWQEARTLVGVDMTPTDADRRMAEWAQFAQPAAAADQVASLLGVVPAKDPGQPIAIALDAAVPATGASAATDSVDAFMPGKAPAPAPVEQVAATPPAPAFQDVAVAAVPTPAPAPEVAIVKATPQPATTPHAASTVATITTHGAYKSRVAAAAPAKGNWYVQLGAYPNARVARDGWTRATRRYTAFAGFKPAGASASVKGASFYRLSVGGFARGDAQQLCRGYRASGGTCFVRAGVGEQLAAWMKPKATQLASR